MLQYMSKYKNINFGKGAERSTMLIEGLHQYIKHPQNVLIHTCTYTHVYTYMYTHIYTHIYHTHTYIGSIIYC